MNNSIVLEYGQRVMFPTYPCTPSPFGFAIQSVSKNDTPVMVEMEIKKYWQDDTDANKYKVSLYPVNTNQSYGIEKLYSSDLKLMIKSGSVKLIEK